ncbi:MAG: hypothetical protein LUC91_00890, partial [Prevotella sp.]|nr:hypothetical protein [Prevotella sp.]
SGKEEDTKSQKEVEDAKNFDVLKYDGVRALRINQNDYAVKCFTHALDIQDDLEVRDYLSQAYIRIGEFDSACRQLKFLAERQPDNLQLLIRLASVDYMMEDYDAMLEVCGKAIQLDENNAETLFYFAKAYIGKDNLNEAIAALSKAISSNAEYYDAYLLRSETFLKCGELEKADEDILFLLNIIDDNEDILILKARIESAKNNVGEAISYYDKVIAVNPFNVDAFRERGEQKIKSGDVESGQDDFDTANEYATQGEDGSEDIEDKVNEAYRNINPMGL